MTKPVFNYFTGPAVLFLAILSPLFFLSFNPVFSQASGLNSEDLYSSARSVDILKVSDLSRHETTQIINTKKTHASCRINDTLVIISDSDALVHSVYNSLVTQSVSVSPEMSRPMIARMRGIISPFELFKDRLNIIYEDNGHVIFQAPQPILDILLSKQDNHFNIIPLKGDLQFRIPASEFLDRQSGRIQQPNRNSDPDYHKKTDAKKLGALIQKMQSFKTRYTYTDSYIKSAEWAKNLFFEMGYDSELVKYSNSPDQYNIVAKTKGAALDKGVFILCAHLDSISEKSNILAPGADDNASGCAAVLEAARILKDSPFINKINFVLFGGEEVGLKGSSAYVKMLKNAGQTDKILGVVNFDMIGFDKKPPLSVLIETKKEHEHFITPFVENAQTSLKASISYHPWGSDHVPFLNARIPCFLIIEDEYAANHNYHKTTDLIDDVNINLVTEITSSIIKTVTSILQD
jgi:hypothetical protein